jgi:hypothetical protein
VHHDDDDDDDDDNDDDDNFCNSGQDRAKYTALKVKLSLCFN